VKALRIAICDDETIILDEVSSYIKKYSKLCGKSELEVFPFNSASSLLNSIDNGALFDIFMLDVYIGDEMGTTLAREIRAREIENPIIFLTTSVEHAPQGYETGTLRYLIKPLEPEKFYEAMGAALLQAEKNTKQLIRLKTENGIESINANNIMYSESHDHHQYIKLDNGQLLKVRTTVSELFAMLAKNDGFFRLGSAYIINLRNIKNLTSSAILLYDNTTIPIPRGKHTELKKVFWNFQCE
jgi:DNA-binding LytR/AlgR family response regulator